jgi:hypothetical protein
MGFEPLEAAEERTGQGSRGRWSKDFRCASILLSGIELMHMIRKGQRKDDGNGHTPDQQFYSLAA